MQFSFKLNTSFQKAAATNYKLGRVTQAMQGKAARMEMAKIIAVTLGTWQALREAGTEPETPQLTPFSHFLVVLLLKDENVGPDVRDGQKLQTAIW